MLCLLPYWEHHNEDSKKRHIDRFLGATRRNRATLEVMVKGSQKGRLVKFQRGFTGV